MNTRISLLKWALLGVLMLGIIVLMILFIGLLMVNPSYFFSAPLHSLYFTVGPMLLLGAYVFVDALLPGRIPGVSLF